MDQNMKLVEYVNAFKKNTAFLNGNFYKDHPDIAKFIGPQVTVSMIIVGIMNGKYANKLDKFLSDLQTPLIHALQWYFGPEHLAFRTTVKNSLATLLRDLNNKKIHTGFQTCRDALDEVYNQNPKFARVFAFEPKLYNSYTSHSLIVAPIGEMWLGEITWKLETLQYKSTREFADDLMRVGINYDLRHSKENYIKSAAQNKLESTECGTVFDYAHFIISVAHELLKPTTEQAYIHSKTGAKFARPVVYHIEPLAMRARFPGYTAKSINSYVPHIKKLDVISSASHDSSLGWHMVHIGVESSPYNRYVQRRMIEFDEFLAKKEVGKVKDIRSKLAKWDASMTMKKAYEARMDIIQDSIEVLESRALVDREGKEFTKSVDEIVKRLKAEEMPPAYLAAMSELRKYWDEFNREFVANEYEHMAKRSKVATKSGVSDDKRRDIQLQSSDLFLKFWSEHQNYEYTLAKFEYLEREEDTADLMDGMCLYSDDDDYDEDVPMAGARTISLTATQLNRERAARMESNTLRRDQGSNIHLSDSIRRIEEFKSRMQFNDFDTKEELCAIREYISEQPEEFLCVLDASTQLSEDVMRGIVAKDNARILRKGGKTRREMVTRRNHTEQDDEEQARIKKVSEGMYNQDEDETNMGDVSSDDGLTEDDPDTVAKRQEERLMNERCAKFLTFKGCNTRDLQLATKPPESHPSAIWNGFVTWWLTRWYNRVTAELEDLEGETKTKHEQDVEAAEQVKTYLKRKQRLYDEETADWELLISELAQSDVDGFRQSMEDSMSLTAKLGKEVVEVIQIYQAKNELDVEFSEGEQADSLMWVHANFLDVGPA